MILLPASLGIAAPSQSAAPEVATAWSDTNIYAGLTLSGGNRTVLKAAGLGDMRSVVGTIGRSSSDGYFEVLIDEGSLSSFMLCGIANGTFNAVAGDIVGVTNSLGIYQDTGEKIVGNTLSAYGAPWKTNGAVVQVFYRGTLGKLWFGVNNTVFGDPVAGTGEAFSGITGTWYPAHTLYRGPPTAHQITGCFAAADQQFSSLGLPAWGAPNTGSTVFSRAAKTANVSLSGLGRIAAHSAGTAGEVRGNGGRSSGKWYFEIVFTTITNDWAAAGFVFGTPALDAVLSTAGKISYRSNGATRSGGTTGATGSALSSGNVLGVAVDIDLGRMWFARNNAWLAGGDPATNYNDSFSFTPGANVTPFAWLDNVAVSKVLTAHFEAGQLVYSPPAGFNAGF